MTSVYDIVASNPPSHTQSGGAVAPAKIAPPKIVPINVNNLVNNISNKELEKVFAVRMNSKKNNADNNKK